MQLAVTIYPYCSLFNEDQVFASGDETRTPKGMADEPSRVPFYRAGVVVAERDVDVNSGNPARGALEVCKYRSNLSRLRRCIDIGYGHPAIPFHQLDGAEFL